jgi:16S rRNA (guanine527-N7)-methyltransferase
VLAAIEGHGRLLLAWNAAINLTAIDEPARVATAHVVDSLTAVAPLRRLGVDRFVDLGSGGGYPGLPLAIALPARQALLVDSVRKKTRFLATVAEAVGAAGFVEVFTGRAETLAADPRHRERWPAVTARAVAGLADLVELAFPLLAPGGVLVAWKRGDLTDELAAARRAVSALGGGSLELVAAAASAPGDRLVIVTKRGHTNSSFPRDPAVRRRARW